MPSATQGNPKAQFMTAFGRAGFPYLHSPDTKYDDEGVYKTDLFLDKKDAAALAKLGNDLIKQALESGATSKPAKQPYEKMDDGTFKFRFKTKHAPAVFDAERQPLAAGLKVGGGTVMRIAGTAQVYEGFGHTGVTWYMNGVQIKELQSFGGDADSFGFDAVEGFSGADLDDDDDLFGDDEGDLDTNVSSDFDDDF